MFRIGALACVGAQILRITVPYVFTEPKQHGPHVAGHAIKPLAVNIDNIHCSLGY